MKQQWQKLTDWWQQDRTRGRFTVGLGVATAILYALIFYIGRRPVPLIPSNIPVFLRWHPERLLACGAALFAMFVLYRRLKEDKPLLEPLTWLFLASFVHLSSLAIQYRLV